MAIYTSTVPQSTQRISDTQPLIQANFGNLPNTIGAEHIFSGDDANANNGLHKQCSMANKGADPVALPGSANGMYYVKGGVPKFYNGSQATFIHKSAVAFSEEFGAINFIIGIPSNVGAPIPPKSFGTLYILKSDAGGTTPSAQCLFTSNADTVYVASVLGASVTGPGCQLLTIGGSGLQITATTTTASITLSYIITYQTLL